MGGAAVWLDADVTGRNVVRFVVPDVISFVVSFFVSFVVPDVVPDVVSFVVSSVVQDSDLLMATTVMSPSSSTVFSKVFSVNPSL